MSQSKSYIAPLPPRILTQDLLQNEISVFHGYQPISMQEQTTPKSQWLKIKVSYSHYIYIVYPFILRPSLKDQPNLGYSLG